MCCGDLWQRDPPSGGFIGTIPVEFMRKAMKIDAKPDIAHAKRSSGMKARDVYRVLPSSLSAFAQKILGSWKCNKRCDVDSYRKTRGASFMAIRPLCQAAGSMEHRRVGTTGVSKIGSRSKKNAKHAYWSGEANTAS